MKGLSSSLICKLTILPKRNKKFRKEGLNIFDKRVTFRLNILTATDLMRAFEVEEEGRLSNMAMGESRWAHEHIGKLSCELEHVYDVFGFCE